MRCYLLNMTPEAIAKLCVTRWVSSDHLMWMAAVLNSEQSNTFCCVLNAVNDVERLAARKLQSHQPNSLVFFVNVGISSGRVMLGNPTIRGNHWTSCQVHHDNKAIVYADTLGWRIVGESLCECSLQGGCNWLWEGHLPQSTIHSGWQALLQVIMCHELPSTNMRQCLQCHLYGDGCCGNT